MSLKPKNDSYSSDRAIALKSTLAQLEFILANMKYLDRVDRTGSHRKFLEDLGPVAGLADWQISRIEKIYELVWKGYDMPSVNDHVDKKRRGLRF
jgi:hypothetical protein